MARIHFLNGDDITVNNIFCIGRNYALHAKEMKSEIPNEPVVFTKPTSSIIQNGDVIKLPSLSSNVHHEVEIVLAIGKEAKHLSEDDAMNHVAGIGIGIDVTARDLQAEAKKAGKPWAVAKGFDTFAPISHFVSPDEFDDLTNTEFELLINGKERQRGNTKALLFPFPTLISYLSSIFTLQRGDLIFTGTPEGVSPIKKGDQLVAAIQHSKISLSVHVD